MGRLRAATVERAERFGDRVLEVAEELDEQGRFRRIIDQLVGCGTSPGAQVAEADEAMSAKDFAKSLGIALKELSERRYWLRTVSRRGWVVPSRLTDLIKEAEELKSIFGAMVVRTRRAAQAKGTKRAP
jgi:four helix bundle protein